jgi:hypothetical protein
MPNLLQCLWMATSETPYFFANCLIGSDQTCFSSRSRSLMREGFERSRMSPCGLETATPNGDRSQSPFRGGDQRLRISHLCSWNRQVRPSAASGPQFGHAR